MVCSNYSVISMSRPSDSEIEIEFDMTLESHNIRKCLEKSFMGGGMKQI